MLARLVGDLASFVVNGVVFLIVAPGLVAWMTRGRVRLHIRIHREGPMGYANRLIRLDFPDLSEEDDPIFVTIRNPKLVPSETTVIAHLADRPDGQQITIAEYAAGNAEVISRLVVVWNVYDANDYSDNPQPMPLPATPELARKLPDEITRRILEEVQAGKAKRMDPEVSISTTS